MLPIFRMIPVGGVFIAMIALVQALTLPGPTRTRLIRVEAPARGPLIDRAEHPEWRQFLILAAIRRAHEILALRDLPDTPVAAPVDRVVIPVAAHIETARQAQVASLSIVPAAPDLSAPAGVEPSVEELALPESEQEATAVPPPAAAATLVPATGTADHVIPEAPASPAVASTEKTSAEPHLAKKLAAISPLPTASDAIMPPAAASANVQPPADTPKSPTQAEIEVPQPSAATQSPKGQTAETPKPVALAELPHDQADTVSTGDNADVTGSVVKSAATTLPVGIGEASSMELPLVLPRPRPNLIKLPRARPAVIPPLHHAVSRRAKPKAADSNARRGPPDLFSALFDKRYQHPTSGAAKPAHAQAPREQQPPSQP